MADLDRLIDEGLSRYGAGDLDGALEAWEEALAIDPDNPQANSYVDYVRQNYDILATDGGAAVTDGGPAPFGIESEPEYTIEIFAGEVGTAASEPSLEDSDEHGWFIDDDDPHTVRVGRAPSRDLAPRTVEIEADEPPQPGISFEDTTREYHNQKPPTDEFADESSFRAEATPLGFGTQETEIKKRNTGFVQPVPRTATTNLPLPSPGGEPPAAIAEMHVRLRTPSSMPPINKKPIEAATDAGRAASRTIEPAPLEPASTPPPPPPAAEAEPVPSLELEPLDSLDAVDPLDALDDLPPLELAPPDRRTKQSAPPPMAPPPIAPPVPEIAEETTGDDLLDSLPMPRRMTPVRGSRASVPPEIDAASEPSARIPTRDLPAPRPPAPAGTADVALATAKTRDLAREGAEDPAPEDLDLELEREPATRRRPPISPIGGDDPVIGIPTRELGLRPPANKRAPSVFPDEDATTTQSDARQFRREAAANDDILTEIDSGAPSNESKDDHLRRRISALIMRATEWNASGELDKAVSAVELALSEDPTSALAQKLLHRNREAIMNVFQTYMGDLERQPQLAKPLHELANAPISPRAAFLLSRIDGMLSIDEILDVSGMPRLEAYRHLCQLFLRGILR
ncbi:MAG TPA: hypothetical protein VGG28_15710 [Kofleriaceae bacterium]